MDKDTNSMLIVAILAIVAYFLLYHPATSELLWVNDCTGPGFTPVSSVRGGSIEPYSETYGVAPYCLLFRASSNYPSEIVAQAAISPSIVANASTGEYSFVYGARVRVRSLGVTSGGGEYGGVVLRVNDANGQTICGFKITKDLSGRWIIRTWPSQSQAYVVFDAYQDKWVDVEVYVNPRGSRLYLNGVRVAEDSLSHVNAAPAYAQVYVYVLGNGQLTRTSEALVDQVYVKKATSWYLGVD